MSCFAEFLLYSNCRYFDNPFQKRIVYKNNSLKNNLLIFFAAFPLKDGLDRSVGDYVKSTNIESTLIFDNTHNWKIRVRALLANIGHWSLKKRISNINCDNWPLLIRKKAKLWFNGMRKHLLSSSYGIKNLGSR